MGSRYSSLGGLLAKVERQAAAWFDALDSRPVRATATAEELRKALGGALPREGIAAEGIAQMLAEAGMRGTVASAGPRYFGFVVGGSLPAALAADWLVSAWDQNTGIYALSPLTSVIEQIAGGWLRELAGLPATMSFGFVTGCQMANFTALAAARHRILEDAGWDVEAEGLCGAPPIEVVASEEAHYTITMALRLLGLGANRVRRIPTDEQGRMRADGVATALRACEGPSIVCAQAGNVNTGAVDSLSEIAELAKERGAWFHVDGAFGLWAAASPERAGLVRGIERADSVATDAHKWLNVPYDCGIVFCGDEAAHRGAMSLAAAYIVASRDERDAHEFVPEESRRGRAIPVYAALRSLGREGLAELVERNCRQAQRFADALRRAGHEVLNEVVLNQVLVSFGTTEETQRTIAALQEDGTCWCGGTVWKNRTAMRISVSNWSTTDEDVDKSVEAMLRAARKARR
ncbi:MAG TPA: aminotransferase class V-fold PLP-dependent enzyme [Bryobacteraceae bacterium]|jgi:glutamate/tyrosine decarboxylase-like PLP-dependent enzyme|nr:aminotransferase class V-fold PLP-dependent enzyme [Bryobacteraceae bacterium]